MFNNDLYWAVAEPYLTNFSSSLQFYLKAGGTLEMFDAARAGQAYRVTGRNAIIPIRGMINKYYSAGSEATSSAATEYAVRSAAADTSIDNIILLLDTPGGSVSGLSALGDTIAQATLAKPVISYVDNLAASAGYYIAANSSRIVAERGSLVGSIGVRMMLYDMSKMFADMGIKPVPIDTGEFKSAGAEGLPITDAQKADFQRTVDSYFNDFKATVSRGRRLDMQSVDKVSDGRMFDTAEAYEYGLIDGVGSFSDLLSSLHKPRMQSTHAAKATMDLINLS